MGGMLTTCIPDQVELGGTIRTHRCGGAHCHKATHGACRNTNLLVCTGHQDATLNIDVVAGAPAVNNDPRLTKHVESVIRSFCGEEAVFHIPRPSMGSEDFGHYLEKIPGMLLRVGTRSAPENAYPLHSAHFDIDESAMAPAATLMAHVLRTHPDQEVG